MSKSEGPKPTINHFLVSIKVKPEVVHMMIPEVIEDAIDKYVGTKNIKMIHVERHDYIEEETE